MVVKVLSNPSHSTILWYFLMHIDIILHKHLCIYNECYISSLCVKLPWFLEMWLDWLHLISVLTAPLVSLGSWAPFVVREKQVLKSCFAWSLWDICIRMREIRFWTCCFLPTECQRSPVLCLGAAVPAPQPPAPCVSHVSLHPWLTIAPTGSVRGRQMRSAP